MPKFTRPFIIAFALVFLTTTSLAFAQTAEQTHRNRMLAMVASTITVMEQTLAMLEQTLLDLKRQVAGIGSTQVEGQALSAEALTFKLLALQKVYTKSPNPALLSQLTTTATERNSRLHAAIASDPSTARNIMLPAALTKSLPAAVLALMEQETTLEGTLDILHEDYEDEDLSIYRHFLTTAKNERLELHFANATFPGLQSGMKVKAKGQLLKRATAASDGTSGDLVVAAEDTVLWLDDGGTNTTLDGSIPAVVPYSIGERRMLMIMVNFYDKPEEPITMVQAQALFNTMDAYTREASAGRTWLTGGVAGWYTINQSATVCDSYNLGNLADSAAYQAGYNLANYDHLMYIFPRNACGYTGSAQVVGKDSFVNGVFTLHTPAHEFGHNLGLDHSHAMECHATTLGEDCYDYWYGDTLDVMGDSLGDSHYNAWNKQRLGWLYANEVTEVSTNATVNIVPFTDLSKTGTRVLKIKKVNDPGVWYYVDYHTPVGFDAVLFDGAHLNVPNITSGVVVRKAGLRSFSEMLDMTPGTGGISSDWEDPALTVGNSFTDPAAGITLTTLATSSSAATVSVSFSGAPACVRAAPTVSITPSSQWADAGQSLVYNLTVKSNDSANCTPAFFGITKTLPNALTQTPTTLPTMLLQPGMSSSTSFTIKSFTTTAGGSYLFSEKATNLNSGFSPGPSATTTATYNVNGPAVDTTKPTTAITSPLSGATVAKRTVVTLTASASDNVGVSRVEFWVNNKRICTDTTSPYTCAWTVPGGKSATHSLQSKTYDAAGNVGVSALVSVVSK